MDNDTYPTPEEMLREVLDQAIESDDTECFVEVLDNIHGMAAIGRRDLTRTAEQLRKDLRNIELAIEDLWATDTDDPRANGWVDSKGLP
jgi:LPS O-antigen subunit length determinant protein (WzzB/FepE family)